MLGHISAFQGELAVLVGINDLCAFIANTGQNCGFAAPGMSCKCNQIRIYVSADGFLYNMVRIIVGTLLEMSEGKISPERLADAVATGKRELAGRTAPAEGLYLNRVFLKPEVEKRFISEA